MKQSSAVLSAILLVAFAVVAAGTIFSRVNSAFARQSSARSLPVKSSAPAPSALTLITNIPGRTTISLNGKWKAIVDPYSTGFGMRLYENRKPRVSGFDDSNPDRIKTCIAPAAIAFSTSSSPG